MSSPHGHATSSAASRATSRAASSTRASAPQQPHSASRATSSTRAASPNPCAVSRAASAGRVRSVTSTRTRASTSPDRSLQLAAAARERSALCRYMERYGALQPLRLALLQLYEQRPQRKEAMLQLRACLGDRRPNMQEWQQMKRQCNDSQMLIASLTAEGDRLRRRLEFLKRGVLPSMHLGRPMYR